MKSLGESSKSYLAELVRRRKGSHIHQPHQLTGLTIAVLLRDLEHKSLYMKLAKEHDPDYLLQLAKSVAERKNIENRGAYFMKLLTGKRGMAR